jgi:hypothetical protein
MGGGRISLQEIIKHELQDSENIFELLVENYKDSLILEGNGFKSNNKSTQIVLAFKADSVSPTSLEITKLLTGHGYSKFKVLSPGKGKIDIVSPLSDKRKALEFLREKGYIEGDHLARFGDQYSQNGNDHGMLSHRYGHKIDGPGQTSDTLSSLSLFPDIVLPSINFFEGMDKELLSTYTDSAAVANNNFKKGYANFILDATKNGAYNPNYLSNLKYNLSGPIIFDQNEIETLEPCTIWYNFVNSQSNLSAGKRKYFLMYGNNYYGRAEGFYSSERKAVKIESHIDRFQLLKESIFELLDYGDQIQEQLLSQKSLLKELDWKLALVYFDNLKSNLLHYFHAFSYLKTQGFITNDADTINSNEQLRACVQSIVSAYFKILNLKIPTKVDFEDIRKWINISTLSLDRVFAETNNRIVSKSVRGLCEADNPLQLNIFAKSIAIDIMENHKDMKIALVGMHFGGIELPYAVKNALDDLEFEGKIEIFSAHFSNYSNPDADFEGNFFDRDLDLSNSDVFLLDDGVFTGGSLATVMDELSRYGGNILPRVMQVGNSRRIGHMQKSGGISPEFLKGQIIEHAVGVTPSARAMTINKFEILEGADMFNLVQLRMQRMMKKYYT